jgi:hypothetical protein
LELPSEHIQNMGKTYNDCWIKLFDNDGGFFGGRIDNHIYGCKIRSGNKCASDWFKLPSDLKNDINKIQSFGCNCKVKIWAKWNVWSPSIYPRNVGLFNTKTKYRNKTYSIDDGEQIKLSGKVSQVKFDCKA